MRQLVFSILGVILFSGFAFGNCATFDSADNGQEALQNHSLYREYYKQKNYTEALPLWEKAYTIAPAANGKTTKHFTNGVTMYKHFLKEEQDAAKKAELAQKVLDLYNHHMECFADDKGEVLGDIAAFMYYNLSDADHQKIYDNSKESAGLLGNKFEYSTFYPYAAATVSLFINETISADDARAVYQMLNDVAEHNIANNEKRKVYYESAIANANKKFKEIEMQIFDCDYFKSELLPQYEADPDNYDVIKAVRAKLIQGGCLEDDPIVVEMETKMVSHIEQVNAENAQKRWEMLPNANKGAKYLKEGDYEMAIQHYKMAIDEATENEKKGDYHYAVAQAYFKLKQYSSARSHARQAAQFKPNWGKPYMLIGSLYASSTRSCGDAFEGRMVVLAAIDKYSYAKSIDPNVADEANRRIGKLAGSKPTAEQVFERGLKNGQSYTVGCWIQEKTTIRTVKGY